MEKKDRLLRLIEHYADGNKSEFARMIGISPQAISTWISRNTFDIDVIYSKCVNISPEWLLTGKGPMLKTALQEAMVVEPVRSESPNKGAPYYDVDFLGGFDITFNDQTINPEYAVVLDTIRTVKILRKSKSPDRMRYVPINEENYDEQEYDNSRILRIFEVLGNVSRFI